ncbi:MAG: SpoIIE family protein phosphatase [Alphaproteobacteria bacterium]|nr:SpoIIE family protein phosphatase [Alphaproteobacteria bacterium]
MYKIFRRYLSIEFFLIVTFIFTLIGVIFTSHCKEEALDLLEMRMDYALRSFNAMKFKLKGVYQDFQVDTLAHINLLENVLEKKSEKELKDINQLKKVIAVLDFDEVSIVDKNGVVKASSNEYLNGTLMEDRIRSSSFKFPNFEDSEDFFLDNLGEKDVFESQISNKKLYFVSIPFKDGTLTIGRPVDMILEQMDIERKRGFINGFKIAETGFVLFVGGKSGRVLASTYPRFDGKFPRELGFNTENFPEKGVFVADLTDYGKVLCYHLEINSSKGSTMIGVYPFSEMYVQRNSMLKLCGFIFLFMYVVSLFSVSHLLKRVVVSGITRTNRTLKQITSGDLFQKVDVDSNPEFKMLSDGINQMVEALHQMMIDREERIQREFKFAQEIQASVLPSVQSVTKKSTDFSLEAMMKPALEIGGDFYDFFFIGKDKGKLCYLIADVSDKGIPAALFMMSAKMLIKNLILAGLSPAEALNEANAELSEKNTTYTFVTVFVAVVDLSDGHVIFANAGHNLPYLHRADGSWVELDCHSGPVLGAIPKAHFEDNEAYYKYNEGLFLYTDGVTEALNEKGVFFGKNTLEKVLSDNSFKNPKEIVSSVYSEVKKFSEDAKQSDDITMVSLKYNVQSLELPAVMENNSKFFEFVDQILEENECPATIASQIGVVLDEIISNVVNYAYQDTNKEPKLKLCCSVHDKMVTLRFIDCGKQFNPLEAEDPDITLPLEKRQIGKLGVFIVKKIMTNITYSFENGCNVLSMQKSFEDA